MELPVCHCIELPDDAAVHWSVTSTQLKFTLCCVDSAYY